MSVKDQYFLVQEEIKKTCPDREKDITLIAVSKTKPVSLLQEVYDCGCRDFGENKVQELTMKYPLLPKDIKWHMIGHLQTNKVKYIVDKVYMIHSVDSLKLANEINKEASKINRIISILIEVNVAEEDTKFGVKPSEVLDLVTNISVLKNISVKGLMTIAPNVTNAEDNREVFRKLKQIAVDMKAQNIDNISMDELSMGMSGDYKVAASEGANYVRVGTGIFGARDYQVSE